MAKKRVVSRRSFVDPDLVGTTSADGAERRVLGTVESQWTCSSCGTIVRGGVKKCPNCGNPKEGSEAYQHPDISAPYLTQPQLDQMGVDPARHDSDEECPYCGSRLKPGTQICPSCSGTISDAARTSRRCSHCGRETNKLSCPNCGAETESKKPDSLPGHSGSYRIYRSFSSGSVNWTYIFVAIVVAVLIFGVGYALWPRQEKATVSAASWTSTIFLEQQQHNQYGGWSIPSGGEPVGSEQKIHHYDKVYDHTEKQCHDERQQDGYEKEEYTERVCKKVYDHTEEECYDDGTCERVAVYRDKCENVKRYRDVPKYKKVQVCEDVKIYRDVPVYATWYIYKIWEWVAIAPVLAKGEGFSPQWPSYPSDSRHRETGRRQEFAISFIVNDKAAYIYNPASVEEFQRYPIGSRWTIKRSGTTVIEVSSD